MAIFAATFNLWQMVGMAIVCLVFFVELIMKWACGAKNKTQEEEQDDFQKVAASTEDDEKKV